MISQNHMKKSFNISKYKPSIFQGSFDFDAVSKRQLNVLAFEYPAERIAFFALSILLAILFCGYFYFVASSVLNIIARKEADAQSAQLQGSIGTLEEQYFALSQTLSPADATTLGLSPVAQTQYVYRPGNAASAGEPLASAI
jgi:hypothetical protein